MGKNINSILREVLKTVKPSDEEIKEIDKELKVFLENIKKKTKELKIDAEIFVGGSYAKGTLIRKDHYDIDVFLRFSEKYEQKELPELATKILGKVKNMEILHGSRDYFRVKIKDNLFFEIVPVKKVKKPEEAENVTDLSASHVGYIKKNVNKKILDEIKIAKAFCHACHCYGAESYIQGFSGYALELLVYYYKGFMKFIKAMKKVSLKEKLVIDISKQYKNKQVVMMDLNSSKLNSPVILIDPTFKQRNALAALSYGTFGKFQREVKSFLKNPSIKAFEQKKTDLEKVKKESKTRGHDFILIEADTDKQVGDIAGSKLLKFYRHLEEEISRLYGIKNKGFNYNKKQTARFFFVAKSKGETILEGPEINDKPNLVKFRSKHKNVFTNKNKLYAREKISLSLKKFLEDWRNKNTQKIQEMYIAGLRVVE